MKMEVEVNDIIENLTQEVSKYIRENAILKAQIKSLQEMIETNQELNESEEIK